MISSLRLADWLVDVQNEEHVTKTERIQRLKTTSNREILLPIILMRQEESPVDSLERNSEVVRLAMEREEIRIDLDVVSSAKISAEFKAKRVKCPAVYRGAMQGS
jgi:argonaute-like protein implicated in RNA metabolism and viral defense